MNVDTVPRTLGVAFVVALVCSTLVASAVSILRPIQHARTAIERNRAIVAATGLAADGASLSDNEVVGIFLQLEAYVVELTTGDFTSETDPHRFDHWEITSQSKSMPTRAPVYLVRKNGELQRLVFPIDGRGMWSTVYGYVAVLPDLTRISEVVILSHGETPGIGDRIKEPDWLAQWRGKHIYDSGGQVRIDVVRNAKGDHQVDLISGASISSDAVGDAIRYWFGDEGYGPFIARIRRDGFVR